MSLRSQILSLLEERDYSANGLAEEIYGDSTKGANLRLALVKMVGVEVKRYKYNGGREYFYTLINNEIPFNACVVNVVCDSRVYNGLKDYIRGHQGCKLEEISRDVTLNRTRLYKEYLNIMEVNNIIRRDNNKYYID